jgi:hypothetical protein
MSGIAKDPQGSIAATFTLIHPGQQVKIRLRQPIAAIPASPGIDRLIQEPTGKDFRHHPNIKTAKNSIDPEYPK